MNFNACYMFDVPFSHLQIPGLTKFISAHKYTEENVRQDVKWTNER
jgi:hypothetical protein